MHFRHISAKIRLQNLKQHFSMGPRSYFGRFKISYLKNISTCNHKTNDANVSKIDYNISKKLFAIN